MKRYLRGTFLMVMLLTVCFLLLACGMILTFVEQGSIKSNLRTVIRTASVLKISDGQNLDRLVRDIASEDGLLRVTLMDGEGNLLADTEVDAAGAENHLLRVEVAAAINNQWGSDLRESKTTGQLTLYVAGRLEDGHILRLSYPVSAVNRYVYAMLLVAFLLLVVVACLIHFMTGRMSGHLMAPLYQIDAMLEGRRGSPDGAEMFPEARPLVARIGEMIATLHRELAETKKTQEIRKDFVANASHELKTPLTSIRGFAELLNTGMVTGETQRSEYLSRIVRESNRLLAMIEDILRLSRAESSAPVDLSDVELSVVAGEIRRALENLSAARGIFLRVEGECVTHANAQEMWELIYNLVDNAVRYGREGGHVAILLSPGCVSVRDDGIGIPESELARVFERFYRVDKSHSRATGGTGLGLAIVKHIALKYGGDVSVMSELGKGSTFTVSGLPGAQN